MLNEPPHNELVSLYRTALQKGEIRDVQGALSFEVDVESIVKNLRNAGVERREAVGISLENGREVLSVYMALAEMNVVAVPLPPSLPKEERQALWSRLHCRFSIEKEGIVSLSGNFSPIRWDKDIDWIFHSSGSTGTPKAITLSFNACRLNAKGVGAVLKLGDRTRVHAGSMSQCYTGGFYNAFLLPLLNGDKVLVTPLVGALKAKEYVELVATQKPQVLWVNPTVVNFLVRMGEKDPSLREKLKSVEYLVSCTAPLTKTECLQAEEILGKPVLQSYGLVETLIVTVETPTRVAKDSFSAGVIVGGPQAVSLDEKGCVRIHNGAVTKGYAHVSPDRFIGFTIVPESQPHKTFLSGDIAKISEDQRMEITGRLTQVINVGGVKISPEQMESTLKEHPQVLESAVIGVFDSQGQERPVAFVLLKSNVDAEVLSQLCVDKLGVKARPLYVRQVASIPKTSTGKIDRRELQKILNP